MQREVCHSIVCSTIFLRVAIWSTQERSCLNPACSSLKVLSTSVFILCNMTLHIILLGIDKSVIPLQLLQRDRSPFFGSYTRSPFRQSSGICSSFHILLIRWWRALVDILSIALITSGGILSTPPDFPFFSCLIALSISSLEVFSILMSSVSPSSISGVIMGGGLFRAS